MLKGLTQVELEEAIRLATTRTVRATSRPRGEAGDRLDKILAALAHPRTRRIVDIVRARPQTASDIAAALNVQRGAVSRYLTNLRDAGIIAETPSPRDARERIISVKPDAFATVDAWINQANPEP